LLLLLVFSFGDGVGFSFDLFVFLFGDFGDLGVFLFLGRFGEGFCFRFFSGLDEESVCVLFLPVLLVSVSAVLFPGLLGDGLDSAFVWLLNFLSGLGVAI